MTVKEEQSYILRTPCKVGDIVYIIRWNKEREYYYAWEMKIKEIVFCIDDIYFKGFSCNEFFKPCDLGKIVFFTEAEAWEKAHELNKR